MCKRISGRLTASTTAIMVIMCLLAATFGVMPVNAEAITSTTGRPVTDYVGLDTYGGGVSLISGGQQFARVVQESTDNHALYIRSETTLTDPTNSTTNNYAARFTLFPSITKSDGDAAIVISANVKGLANNAHMSFAINAGVSHLRCNNVTTTQLSDGWIRYSGEITRANNSTIDRIWISIAQTSATGILIDEVVAYDKFDTAKVNLIVNGNFEEKSLAEFTATDGNPITDYMGLSTVWGANQTFTERFARVVQEDAGNRALYVRNITSYTNPAVATDAWAIRFLTYPNIAGVGGPESKTASVTISAKVKGNVNTERAAFAINGGVSATTFKGSGTAVTATLLPDGWTQYSCTITRNNTDKIDSIWISFAQTPTTGLLIDDIVAYDANDTNKVNRIVNGSFEERGGGEFTRTDGEPLSMYNWKEYNTTNEEFARIVDESASNSALYLRCNTARTWDTRMIVYRELKGQVAGPGETGTVKFKLKGIVDESKVNFELDPGTQAIFLNDDTGKVAKQMLADGWTQYTITVTPSTDGAARYLTQFRLGVQGGTTNVGFFIDDVEVYKQNDNVTNYVKDGTFDILDIPCLIYDPAVNKSEGTISAWVKNRNAAPLETSLFFAIYDDGRLIDIYTEPKSFTGKESYKFSHDFNEKLTLGTECKILCWQADSIATLSAYLTHDLVKTRVACVGDSITAGYGASTPSDRYPAQLQNLLGSDYIVDNFGSSGATFSSYQPYSQTDVYARSFAFDPDVVVIMLGTNETKNMNNINNLTADCVALINQYKAVASEVYVALPPPINSTNNSNLLQIKDKIQAAATQTGCTVIDVYSAFPTDSTAFGNLMHDEAHPNSAGMSLIAQTVATQLKSGSEK